MALAVPVTVKTTEEGENERLDYAVSAMQGCRVNMEDDHAIALNLDAATGTSFLGVYNGHGGPAVSKYCTRHLHIELRRDERFRDNIRIAIERTRMDEMMKDRSAGNELSRYDGNDNWKTYRKALLKSRFLPSCQKPEYRGPETNGCTACVVLIRGNQIIVGNAGDSRCVLSRNNLAVDLSNDFKPSVPAERQRIEAAGHRVTFSERGNMYCIDDGIAISRSLGDLMYNDNYDLGPQEQTITAFPEVLPEQITQDGQFLIISCDGIWILSSAMARAVPIRLKNTEEGENERLDYAVSAMQGHSENMEDVHAIILNLDAAIGKLFFGVCDGHGGPAVLKYCARHLHIEVCRHERFRDNLQIAIERTFLRMDDVINRFVCWLGSFSCLYKCNNLWSMLATTAGSSRASVTRNSAKVTQNNKSTDSSNSVGLRGNTRRARGKEDEGNGGPGDGRGQPKVHGGGDELLKVTVSSVEDLENLDPNAVMLSIFEHATREAASEILREGSRRSFLFDKDKPYYKAVCACVLENTESEEKEGLDPDYHPSEECDTRDGEEVSSEQPLDVDESVTRDEEETSGGEINGQPLNVENTKLDSRWVLVEESDYPPSPLPLEIIWAQPSGSVTSPASQTNDREPPAPPVGESFAAENVQDEDDVTAQSQSPPSAPASSVGPGALIIWMPAQNRDEEAMPADNREEDVRQSSAAAEEQSTPEGLLTIWMPTQNGDEEAMPAENGEEDVGQSSTPAEEQSTPEGPLALGTADNYSPPPPSAPAGPVALGILMPGQSSGAGAVEEAQINLRFGRALFHCRSCLLPLKPPTFKCDYGHVICGTCCNSHEQVCRGAAVYSPCVEVDAFVRDAKQPCAYAEFGCKSSVVYFEAAEHERACQWAPCSCPDPACGFFSSPARLADHFAAAHSWPVTEVSYGQPLRVALPPPQGWHVLVGEEGQRVFLMSACALGTTAAAVSLVCLRASGDASEGAPQFRCKLWAEAASSKESVAMMMCMVVSTSMSGSGAGGVFSAADQGMFLAMPRGILDDVVGGEAPVLMVRIDRVGAAVHP